MESIILNGSGISQTWNAGPMHAMYVKQIDIDIPMDEIGSTSPSVTLSGQYTGAHTFYGGIQPNLRFKANETVYITTENFTSEYTAVINYITVGDQAPFMQTDTSRKNARFVPTPWRLR